MTFQVGRGGNDASVVELFHCMHQVEGVYFTKEGYWVAANAGIMPSGMGHAFKFLQDFVVNLLQISGSWFAYGKVL